MKHWTLAGSTAVIALLAGTGLRADVTPEDVWQSWQSMAKVYGGSISSTSAARDGNSLVVKGLEMSSEKDGFTSKTSIDELIFMDKGDGTVAVTMSDSYPMEMTIPASADIVGDSPTKLSLEISQPGMTMLASGTPEQVNYAYDAPNGTVKLKAIEGKDATTSDVTVEATLTGLKGKYTVSGADAAKKFVSDFSLSGLALAVVGEDAAKNTSINFTANVADLAGSADVTTVGKEMMADLGSALKAGFAMKGSFSHGGVDFNMDVKDADKPSSVKGSSTKGDLAIEIGGDRLHYQGTGGAVEFSLKSPDIPVGEVKVSYDETAFNVDMPATKSDTPVDFTFLTKIVGLKISDEVWGMFDPTAALPRDPATLIFDSKGTATMTSDIFNEAEMAALGDKPPGQLNSFTLNELKLTAVGTDLAGSGALTFDNTDTTTYQGMPAPTGTMEFKMQGANKLIDSLKAMGLVSDDELMGVRMMMGMMTKVTGDDELSSKVEFKDKHLFVNDQQMQ